MDEVESLALLRNNIKNYDGLPNNLKTWLNVVVNRVNRVDIDFKTYMAIERSSKDLDFLKSLNLTEDMSYYVVSNRREFLEKFRVYMQVFVPKNYNDYISFSSKVFLNFYVREVNDEKFNIDEMLISRTRLQVYCHKNNHMSDKQTAWVQGNLLASDICDRLIRGSKILILAEYDVDEIDNLLGSFKLRKIKIKDNDMQLNGLYNVKNDVDSGATTINGEVMC